MIRDSYNFSPSFPGPREAPKKSFARKIERERREWLERAQRKLDRLYEENIERLELERSNYWQKYYEGLYARKSETLAEESKKFVQQMEADFTREKDAILKDLRENLRAQVKNEVEQEYVHRLKDLEQRVAQHRTDANSYHQYWKEAEKEAKSHNQAACTYAAEANKLTERILHVELQRDELLRWKADAIALMSKNGLLDPPR